MRTSSSQLCIVALRKRVRAEQQSIEGRIAYRDIRESGSTI